MDKPTSFGTSTHREVVMVAINKLLSSGKENVLTFGLFQYVKGNFDDSNIKSHNFSNNCGPVLKPVWKTLYNRIGENLMLHLLCRTSLFIPGGSKKCAYVQITGKPISGIKPTVVEYVLQKRRRIEKETGSDVKNPDSKDLKRKGCYEDVTPLKKFKHHLNDSKKKKEEEEKNHYIQQKKFKKHFLSEIKEKRWEELSKVTPSKPDDRCFLPIKICYNKSGVEKINSSSVLERPISQRSVRQLLTSIFFSGSKKKNKNKRIPKRYIKIEELLREFLKRHQYCSPLRFLDIFCKVPNCLEEEDPSTKFKCKGTKKKVCRQFTMPDDMEALIGMTSTKEEVYAFVKNRLLQNIPLQIWGSKSNRNAFLSYVKMFLSLGRLEKINIQELTSKIKVTDCEWVFLDFDTTSGTNEILKTIINKQKEMVHDLYYWIMNGYVMQLLHTSFYVTETHVSRHELVFYRKVVWNKIHKLALESELKNGTFKAINKTDATKYLAKYKCGLSNLRFVPKQSSCRPIVNTRVSGKKALSNQRVVFDILTGIVRNYPSMIGASLKGFSDFYPRWKKFVLSHHSTATKRPLYFVKTDIQKCFDSILPDRLLTIITTTLEKAAGFFVVEPYTVVARQCNKVNINYKRIGFNMAKYRADYITFVAKNNHNSNNVFINKVWTKFYDSREIVAILKQLLMHNIVKIGGRYFIRQCGIDQGGSTSAIFTSLYYGYMELCHLYSIADDGILVRQTDDYLFVTRDKKKAEHFLNVLLPGIEGFGCKVRFDKTLANFPFTYNGEQVETCSGLFPWCGILVNPETLDVMNDYSRYVNVDMRFTMSITRYGDLINNMESKLCQSMFTKTAIYVDPKINKKEICLKNIYEMFLLQAYRFHSYQRTLPQEYKPQQNPKAFKGMLFRLFSKFYRRRVKRFYLKKQQMPFTITRSEVIWLGCKAAITKFEQHPSLYKKLIKLLRKQQQIPKRLKPLLIDATMPALPEDFKSIVS
ncbi:telomerase reverse transcriptase-like isoform X2 [Antedon mediterranea]